MRSVGDVDMELEDLEADRTRVQAEKDTHATKVNRARCGPIGGNASSTLNPKVYYINSLDCMFMFA